MKPDEITLELKFSREMSDGIWRGIKAGAKASLEPNETLAMGLKALYEELSAEGRALWGMWHRKAAQDAVGDEKIEEPPTPPEPELPSDPSMCPVHHVKMKLRSWGGYSHKVGDKWCQGHWCVEHNTPLYKNTSADGGEWYSHIYEDPGTGEQKWCRGQQQEEEEIPF